MKTNASNKDSAPAGKTELSPEIAAVEAKFKKWFPDLPGETLAILAKIHADLIKFNKTVTLIPTAAIKNAENLLVGDSVLGSRIIFPKMIGEYPLYDLSGATGCPGLVFAVLYPQKRVMIVDRDKRKLEFCRLMIESLGLKNAAVQVSGLEELPSGSVHNLVARGLAPLQKAMLVARKAVVPGGRFFHMKGDGWANELASVPSQLFTYWSPSLLGQYKIPDSNIENAVVLTEKTAE